MEVSAAGRCDAEDPCCGQENANYGRIRMFQALQYQKEIGELGKVTIPSEGTVRKIMEQINLIHKPKRKPNGITKADREARKSDDLRFLTAMTCCQWVWRWRIICVPNCAVKH